MNINNSLLTIHTTTEKKVNEDYISSFKNEILDFKGIVLGDGIGSHFKPELGSKFCVSELVNLLEKSKSISDLDFNSLFKKVSNALKKEFENTSDEIEPTKAFGTTLVCVLEFKDKFIVAYIGNGSVWHLRGNYPTLINKQRYLPWSALNILNPHTIDEGGKEALYKFFALKTSENQVDPSVLTITKDNLVFGDLLIVTTDGLYSNDHIPIAKDAEGGLWIGGEKKIEMLFHSLKEFSNNKDLTNDNLDNALTLYSELIKEQRLLDDDTTFGVIYTGKAIEYQNKANEDNTSQ